MDQEEMTPESIIADHWAKVAATEEKKPSVLKNVGGGAVLGAGAGLAAGAGAGHVVGSGARNMVKDPEFRTGMRDVLKEVARDAQTNFPKGSPDSAAARNAAVGYIKGVRKTLGAVEREGTRVGRRIGGAGGAALGLGAGALAGGAYYANKRRKANAAEEKVASIYAEAMGKEASQLANFRLAKTLASGDKAVAAAQAAKSVAPKLTPMGKVLQNRSAQTALSQLRKAASATEKVAAIYALAYEGLEKEAVLATIGKAVGSKLLGASMKAAPHSMTAASGLGRAAGWAAKNQRLAGGLAVGGAAAGTGAVGVGAHKLLGGGSQ